MSLQQNIFAFIERSAQELEGIPYIWRNLIPLMQQLDKDFVGVQSRLL